MVKRAILDEVVVNTTPPESTGSTKGLQIEKKSYQWSLVLRCTTLVRCVLGGGGPFDNGRARHYISKELLLSVFGGFNVYLQNTVFWQESDLYRKKIWLKIYTNKICAGNTPTPERIPSQNQMWLLIKISLVSCQKSANSVSVKEDTYEGDAAKLYGCCWPRITRSYGRGAMIRISWRRWLHEDVIMRAECGGGCWKPPVEKTVKCTQKARPWRHCKHTTARTETVCVTR